MSSVQTVIAAFSEDHTERLTGISKSQLRYWDRTGFFRPSYAEDNRRFAFGRAYLFKDIVALRVLNVLRNQYSVPLQHLRSVSDKLSHLLSAKWAGVSLWVFNKHVIWQEPGTEKPKEIVSEQYVMPALKLDKVVADTKRDVSSLNARDKSKYGKLEQSRYLNHNALVIAGTRISVDSIKRFSEAGYTTEQILKEYPDLSEQDVATAIEYEKPTAAA